MFRPEGCRGTAAAVAATGAAVEAATGAAVEAATGAAAKVTAAAVCCGSVRGATEVAVVNGAKAECSGRSGAGGTAAAVAATGAAVGSVGGWGGTNNDDLEGSSPVQREFLSENFVVGAFPQPLADSGGGVINPNPSAGRILGRRRRASERVELRPFTRATVRACCSRTSSYARCWRSRARSQ